jgi:membrane protein implicated in regulation of membrane protease activity
MEYLTQLDFWHWWVVAFVFLIIEVFAPGVVFLWLAIAAGLVGFLLLALPETSWQIQLIVWAVLSVVAVFAGRAYLKRRPIESDQPALNRRGEQYVGRMFTLDEPIVNGLGKIRVDDSTWKIEGDKDLPSGTKIKVTAADGTVLKVEPA